MKEQFLRKWSNWWILTRDAKQLNEAFARELNELIERELALRQPPVVGRSEQLRAFKQFCQENYGIDISHRIIDEFERYGS